MIMEPRWQLVVVQGLPARALLFPAEPTLLSGAVDDSSISTALVEFASSLLFVHGVDKELKQCSGTVRVEALGILYL